MGKIDKFSERLTDLMFNAKNMTSKQLGSEIGVGDSTVRLWKENRRNIRLSNAIKIAEYFSCSLEYLFGRCENKLDFSIRPVLPFYKQLRDILKEREISLYRIVKETKITNGNLDSWRKGGDPFMQTVIDLVNYLDVSIDYFVGRDR